LQQNLVGQRSPVVFLYFSLFYSFEDVNAKGAALFGKPIPEWLGDTFSEEGLKLPDNQGIGVRSDRGLSKPITWEGLKNEMGQVCQKVFSKYLVASPHSLNGNFPA